MENHKQERIAVYPGSFDPVTFGHMDVIERSCKIFDRVIVAVLENSRKGCLFPVQERVGMVKKSVPGVDIESFSGLLVDFLRKNSALFVIRGLRAVSDFDYEFQMAIANKGLYPDLETIFIMTDKKYFYLNSGLVKELARNGAPLSDFVPPHVEAALREKFK